MLFTSFQFVLFLPIVFFLYWLIFNRTNTKISNLFLIVASYIFYGWWNWKICFLLFGVSAITYGAGYLMTHIRKTNPECEKGKKINNPIWWINFATIGLCIGTLGLFKYGDFFIQSFVSAFGFIGINLNVSTLNLILPLGISFYIFQSLTYTIDIYQRKIEHTNDIVSYFAFMSFFPQLLSGPIGRASHLLPQYGNERKFDYNLAISGCWQILWGLFMKVCVADRLSVYVDTIYGNLAMHNGSSVALAAIFYSIQIYCDFAGYSLMAIGIGRLFGIKLDENFRQPYFAKSIGEFWRRWHISLSTWFRDYVYIPLGGNRVSEYRNYFNLFITFLVSGLWHGAAWSFVLWGGLHGLYQVLDKIRKKYLPKIGLPTILKDSIGIVTTFAIVTIAWIFFRLTDINMAWDAVVKIFTSIGMPFVDLPTFVYGFSSIAILLSVDFLINRNHNKESNATKNSGIFTVFRFAFALILVFWIISTGIFGGGQFIYFQF
jgi:D-alanyl-lipoteichoic acid acyltransferase DltB (MBOAT superfamily)